MLNVAMLSKWHVHSGGYAKEFAEIPGVTVTVVWDEDAARGAEWAKEIGCDFEPDLQKLLARSDVDAVSVGTPTTMHKDVICACAKAKKHIFTEKVLATTAEEARIIEKAVKDAGVVFTISYPKRTEGRILFVKRLIDEGKIGDLTHFYVRNAHDGATAGWLPDSFYDVSQCGGGAMMDLGAHPMYLCLYFMGEPESVSSTFTEYCHKGADDNCVSVLKYKNGAIAVSETGFVSRRSPLTLEFNGTKGTIYLSDLLDGGVTVNTDEETRTYTKDEIAPGTELPVPLFVKAVVNGDKTPFTVEEGVQLSRLMEAAYRAADAGKSVAY